MEKFTNYLREQLQNKAEVTEYVNAALEQYFLDRNRELFLSTLKEAIVNLGELGSRGNCKLSFPRRRESNVPH